MISYTVFSIQIKPGIWIPVNAIVCMVKLYFVASLPSMLVFFFIYFIFKMNIWFSLMIFFIYSLGFKHRGTIRSSHLVLCLYDKPLNSFPLHDFEPNCLYLIITLAVFGQPAFQKGIWFLSTWTIYYFFLEAFSFGNWHPLS